MIKPRVVFLDLDGTLIKGHSQELFMKYLFEKGFLSKRLCAKITFHYFAYKLGLMDNFALLRNEAFSALKGISARKMFHVCDDFFKEVISPRIKPAMVNIISLHKARGDFLVLITATMSEIADRVSQSLGLCYAISTELEIEDGLYTGEILNGPVYADEKARIANKFIKAKSFSLFESYCYTDHVSDLPLLSLVDNPITVSPHPALRRIARCMGWLIIK
jgi:HAD superfamily hydrolase (TIGR01490 family)